MGVQKKREEINGLDDGPAASGRSMCRPNVFPGQQQMPIMGLSPGGRGIPLRQAEAKQQPKMRLEPVDWDWGGAG